MNSKSSQQQKVVAVWSELNSNSACSCKNNVEDEDEDEELFGFFKEQLIQGGEAEVAAHVRRHWTHKSCDPQVLFEEEMDASCGCGMRGVQIALERLCGKMQKLGIVDEMIKRGSNTVIYNSLGQMDEAMNRMAETGSSPDVHHPHERLLQADKMIAGGCAEFHDLDAVHVFGETRRSCLSTLYTILCRLNQLGTWNLKKTGCGVVYHCYRWREKKVGECAKLYNVFHAD
ncbi:hypothetical protein SELMODRAFT_419124 [Selaginella moellendorffii]|uniref:Uncharacterized protein n=1 Tax=Selaginella moellendorffii TaxID=88036 RepID=D8S7X5_SELML|nr:hypothetical protein SELMODRAFT_419124 [Selaginella moellendorffii]